MPSRELLNCFHKRDGGADVGVGFGKEHQCDDVEGEAC